MKRFFVYENENRPICIVTETPENKICGLCYACERHCHCNIVRLVISNKLTSKTGYGITVDFSPQSIFGDFYEVSVDMTWNGRRACYNVVQISEEEVHPGFAFAIERVNAIIRDKGIAL